MDQSTLAVIYFSGLMLAEALRLPQRINRFKNRSIWNKPVDSTQIPERIVLIAIVFGIWILPLVNSLTSWFNAFNFSLARWLVWVGIIFFLIGLVIRTAAQLKLSRSWSFTLETATDQKLIQTGIYSVTRHPIYVSLIFWAIAQPVLLQNYIAGFGGAIAVVLIWFIRVPREEELMLKTFGDEYDDYISRTGRIFSKRHSAN
jgi:protein-S-isoprenylcysteine O-methyltransferase Ste14